ncbi:hypothetical protein MnTg02_01403 [bacterium MnTg02]|nr:hypothetical protein MnTg02_01403 [bacterium MnTg02]
MPKYLTFSCRGFSLFLPLLITFAYAYLIGGTGTAGTVTSVAVIRDCVAAERKGGRDGTACVGRFFKSCQEKPENNNPHDQMECLEREFVFWDRIVNDEFAILHAALKEKGRAKRFRDAQSFWTKYQHSECRLPYSVFGDTPSAQDMGMHCSITRTARRAIEMLDWQEILKGKIR